MFLGKLSLFMSLILGITPPAMGKRGSFIKYTIFRHPETENRTKKYQAVIILEQF